MSGHMRHESVTTFEPRSRRLRRRAQRVADQGSGRTKRLRLSVRSGRQGRDQSVKVLSSWPAGATQDHSTSDIKKIDVTLDPAMFACSPTCRSCTRSSRPSSPPAGRHAEHEDPQRGPRRRRQPFRPEGHRQRPPGLDPPPRTTAVAASPSAQAAQPCGQGQQEESAGMRSALSDRAGRRQGAGRQRVGWMPSTRRQGRLAQLVRHRQVARRRRFATMPPRR